ncbi:MAG: AAA family ATPase [Chloroflexota bacterium]|nr:AAA family ATPase [Chloroflexota bacterium]
MLKKESSVRLLDLTVQNVRGLRDTRLQPGSKNIVIWGPNGAGKSGVVDAIDFVLTGRISRLVGEGTAGITLARHGPHIDHDPESAVVTATVELGGFADPITLRRCLARPDEVECPEEARATLAQIGDIVRRGGVILTRRDILRYVAAEAGTRADEIQELLNLKDIEAIREGLYRARTELRRNEKNAQGAIDTAKAEVNVTLGAPKYSDERLLKVANECRKMLGGDLIDVTQSSAFKKGLAPPTPRKAEEPAFNRTLFQKVIENIRQVTRQELATELAHADRDLRQRVTDIKAHAELLAELDRLELTRHAMRFVDDATTECPVCGASWPEGHLMGHLKARIATAQEAEAARKKIAVAAEAVAAPSRNLRANVNSLTSAVSGTKVGERLRADTETISAWQNALDRLLGVLGDPVASYLDSGISESSVACLLAPEGLGDLLTRLEGAAREESPEPTPEQTAWDTLTRLGESVRALENRNREKQDATLQRSRAEILLTEYEKARDSVLQGLYTRIAGSFVDFYRILHDHEKDHFNAQLQPHGAGLRFEVDFLGRGAHPPHALHSEGHQDSMGVCLFLSLNEELSKGKVDLVVLDDVIMSVDTGHRKDVCRLLREKFPDHQFVITTHDKTWAKQLKQEGVVEPPQVIEFTGWTIDTGPRVHQQLDLWQAIAAEVDRDDIPGAAFKLRRGSEDFFESVCDALGAELTYNSAMQWQLDDWLPAAMVQYKALLQRARRAAESWGNKEVLAALNELESVRKQIYGLTYVEQWAINASVHYNNWENMSRQDFSPVVDAFRDLHALFLCSICGGMLQKPLGKGSPEVVKCLCGKVNWNLKQKPTG